VPAKLGTDEDELSSNEHGLLESLEKPALRAYQRSDFESDAL